MNWYQPLLYVWALPATTIGLSLAPVVLIQGGSIRLVRGVVEIHGGTVTRLLRRGLPWVGAGAAMTLGHVIWGRDQRCLDHSREHEHVHVRQYERWGPLMLPLYLTASLVLYLRGFDPYLGNPFEREAYDQVP